MNYGPKSENFRFPSDRVNLKMDLGPFICFFLAGWQVNLTGSGNEKIKGVTVMVVKAGRRKPEGSEVVAEYQVIFALLRAGEVLEVLDTGKRTVEIYDTDGPEDKQKARDKLGQSVASIISRNRFVTEREEQGKI